MDPAGKSRFQIKDVLPFLLAIVLVLLLTATFMSQERNYYYWLDYNYYEWATRTTVWTLQKTPLLVPGLLWLSTDRMYNLLFTPIPAAAVLLFGDTRLVFIESLTVGFMLPYALTLAAIAMKLTVDSTPSKRRYWAAVAISLAVPTMWIPSLRGYPDACAALLVALAVLFYLDLPRPAPWKKLFLIGLCVGFAPLLRRHFAYDLIAFMAAVSINEVVVAFPSPGQFFKDGFKRILVVAAGSATVLATVGFLFVRDILSNDYGQLYVSDRAPLADTVHYFIATFGIATWAMAILGYVLALKWQLLDRARARFFLIFAVLAGCLWVLPRMLAVHYNLHYDPFVIVGLILFVLVAAPCMQVPLRMVSQIGFGLVLLINLSIGFAPASVLKSLGVKPFRPGMLAVPEADEGSPAWLLLSANYPPWQRQDDAELNRLVDYLRNATEVNKYDKPAMSDNDPRPLVFIPSYSTALQQEILRNAERKRFGLMGDRLLAPPVPCVDSRDSYPLERLMRAQYVVLPDSMQGYIRPSQHRLLAAMSACFKDNWEIARDFTLQPEQFVLGDGVQFSIYKRRQPTSLATAAKALEQFRNFVGARPGSQPLWISTGDMSNFWMEGKKKSYAFPLNNAERFDPAQSFLLYAEPLPPHLKLEVEVKGASGLSVGYQLLDQNGALVRSGPSEGAGGRFNFDIDCTGAKFLALDLQGKPDADAVTLTINRIN